MRKRKVHGQSQTILGFVESGHEDVTTKRMCGTFSTKREIAEPHIWWVTLIQCLINQVNAPDFLFQKHILQKRRWCKWETKNIFKNCSTSPVF